MESRRRRMVSIRPTRSTRTATAVALSPRACPARSRLSTPAARTGPPGVRVPIALAESDAGRTDRNDQIPGNALHRALSRSWPAADPDHSPQSGRSRAKCRRIRRDGPAAPRVRCETRRDRSVRLELLAERMNEEDAAGLTVGQCPRAARRRAGSQGQETDRDAREKLQSVIHPVLPRDKTRGEPGTRTPRFYPIRPQKATADPSPKGSSRVAVPAPTLPSCTRRTVRPRIGSWRRRVSGVSNLERTL